MTEPLTIKCISNVIQMFLMNSINVVEVYYLIFTLYKYIYINSIL